MTVRVRDCCRPVMCCVACSNCNKHVIFSGNHALAMLLAVQLQCAHDLMHRSCRLFQATFVLILIPSLCLCTATHSAVLLLEDLLPARDLPALSLQRLHRCAGVRGSSCALYYAQSLQPLQQPRVLDKSCPISAHNSKPCGLGVCHGDTGLCDCPAGTTFDHIQPCWAAVMRDTA